MFLMITVRETGPNVGRCAFVYQYFSYYWGEEASLEMSVVAYLLLLFTGYISTPFYLPTLIKRLNQALSK